MVDSGGLSIPCMISITNIFHPTDRITTHHTPSCHTGHTRLDEELGTSSGLPKTETFPASFRQARKAYEDDYCHKHDHFQQQENLQYAWEHLYALMSLNISSHKITDTSCRGGIAIVSANTHKIMPEFRMLAFKVWKGRVHSKTFESFLLSPKILFKIFLNQYVVSKTVPKSCLDFSEINLKIN